MGLQPSGQEGSMGLYIPQKMLPQTLENVILDKEKDA